MSDARAPRELVVLLHGLGRTRLSMRPMARALERAGFETLNCAYPGRSASVQASGSMVGQRIAEAIGSPATSSSARVHLVGHSLGNIVIRWVIAHHRPEPLGRVVMLAPPNRGSRVADRLAPWLAWFCRPLRDLTTGAESTARSIRTPAGIEIGVIAAGRDGKVSVAETHLEGESDHIVVPAYHTFLMGRRDVQTLTIRFLRTGRFGPRR